MLTGNWAVSSKVTLSVCSVFNDLDFGIVASPSSWQALIYTCTRLLVSPSQNAGKNESLQPAFACNWQEQ